MVNSVLRLVTLPLLLLPTAYAAALPTPTNRDVESTSPGIIATSSFRAVGFPTSRSPSQRAADTVNIAEFGAVGDLVTLPSADVTVTTNETALTSSASIFKAAMVGKTIVLPNAGRGGKGLLSIISGFTDSQHIILLTPASTTLTGIHEALEVGTDNTAAFNRAIATAEGRQSSGGGGTYSVGSVFVPDGMYLVKTLNLTGFQYSSLKVFGSGYLVGANAGRPVVDMLGSSWIRWSGVGILGDQYAMPSVGILIGRVGDTDHSSADNFHFSDFLVSGFFTTAALLDEQSETSEFDKIFFYNNNFTPAAYGIILDGYRHFGPASASSLVTNNEPIDHAGESFNEQLFTNCIFSGYTSVWSGGTGRLTMLDSYLVSVGGPGIEFYEEIGGADIQAHLDVHMETPSGVPLPEAFLISGTAANPNFDGFWFHDNGNFATRAIFAVDAASAVAKVSVPDAHISVVQFAGDAPTLVSDPSKWGAVSGQITLPTLGNMNLPDFRGLLMTNDGMTVDYSAVSMLPGLGVAPTGEVASVNITNGGNFYIGQRTAYTPTLTLSAPLLGATATAVVSALRLAGWGGLDTANPGTGYSVGDDVPVTDPTGQVWFYVKIFSVGARGVITGLSLASMPPSLPSTAIPTTLTVTQLGGSGALLRGTNFRVAAVNLSHGTGYVAAPRVSFSDTGSGGKPAASTTLAIKIAATSINVSKIEAQDLRATSSITLALGQKVRLDDSGNKWVQEDPSGKVVIGSGPTRLFSIDASGNVIAKGKITAFGTP